MEANCSRIGMGLKIADKPSTESRLKSKVDAVERHAGRKLRSAQSGRLRAAKLSLPRSNSKLVGCDDTVVSQI